MMPSSPHLLWLLALLAPRPFLASEPEAEASMPLARRLELRETVREMFYHTYGAYMKHAFPHDELRPLSASWTDSLVELGNAVKPTREHYHGVALTLIDSLDTLAVLGNVSEFHWAVRWVGAHVTFDQDADVSLFETNIRVLGGLLSAHMLAAGESVGAAHLALPGYDGELLRLAVDLGDRLLSAFDGGCHMLPRSFVNLRGGLPRHNALQEQCTAGVGTLLLEFGILSRLSADARYEQAALCALRLLWSKRSSLNLLGNTLDVRSGSWRNPSAGIGAGIDSFYEYSLKSFLVFGRPELFSIWNASYQAAQKHLRVGPWYLEANMNTGGTAGLTFDALQAFWPAMQVLAGDVDAAAATQTAFHSLWSKFRVLPERFDVHRNAVHASMAYYPLRPELSESTYALYRATGSAKYLAMGEEMVHSLNAVARNANGFAGIKSVIGLEQEDHTPSYFLAETLKYLYLLFDEDNFLNVHSSSYIFTTEGHLIPLSDKFAFAVPSPRQLDQYSVAKLKDLIEAAGLAHSDCLEKADLKDRARQAAEVIRTREGLARRGLAADPQKLSCCLDAQGQSPVNPPSSSAGRSSAPQPPHAADERQVGIAESPSAPEWTEQEGARCSHGE